MPELVQPTVCLAYANGTPAVCQKTLAAGRRLAISRKYADVSAAPILHLHRHEDGYIAFATERDGDDFRPLISIN